jgi:hypothetical protein
MKNKGFVVKRVYKLVETVHTSIGLWGLKLIKSEIQPETLKKSFTRRDNTLTGSLIV